MPALVPDTPQIRLAVTRVPPPPWEAAEKGAGPEGSVAGREAATTVLCGCLAHCTNGYNTLLPELNRTGWLTPVRNQVRPNTV